MTPSLRRLATIVLTTLCLIGLMATPDVASAAGKAATAPVRNANAHAARLRLPAGTIPCRSSVGKPSSPDAACTRSTIGGPRVRPFGGNGFSISLAANVTSLAPGGTTTLTATSNADVGPTPYYIELFDATTGSFLVRCGWGTTCSTSVTQGASTVRSYIAYVSDNSTTSPPFFVLATSNQVGVSWLSISIGSSRSGTSLSVTGYASMDIGPTPYYIEIFQWHAGSPIELAICGSGMSCSTGSQNRPSPDYYTAYVSGYGTTWTPPNIRASSGWIYV